MDYVIDSTTEALYSTGGIALVGKIFERIGFGNNQESQKLTHPEILKALAGLFVQGRNRYEEIRLFREDQLFRDSLGLSYVPAVETLRLYLEQMAGEKMHVFRAVEAAQMKLLKRSPISPVQVERKAYLPVDIDTSPFDNSKSNKEGVSRTYKQFDGYHPIFSYIGREGYMLSCELREGKQHCQKGTPEYLRKTIALAEELKSNKSSLLFRLDGGNDAKETLHVLSNSEHFFIVKRNLRKELPEYWLSVARAEGKVSVKDEKKTVYTGFHTGKSPAGDQQFPPMDVIFEVTERQIAKDGTKLLFPEITVQTFWTNLYESPETVIKLYHDHGTSEQFHSELKTDMNIEQLPSGKFGVNEMILHVAMIAFNTLRFIGQKALEMHQYLPYKTEVMRKRLRKVIDDLIRIAVKVVTHARTVFVKLWIKDPWLECFEKLYLECCSL